MLDAGIHFGHRSSRWNPKMAPYIFSKRNSIHIIDVKETLKGLLRAKTYITRVVAQGGDVLFVGTKRQARAVVTAEAQRVGMHCVAERWLGGILTNFRTIRSRLARLEELEGLEATGELAQYSKKMISKLQREKTKIKRNLDGIRRMNRLPAVLVIVDVRREHIAVREARKLGIPTVCLIDTDSDPEFADIPIPGNDDALRVIELVVHELGEAVLEGKRGQSEEAAETAEAGPKSPRRSRRPTTARAGDEAAAEAPPAQPAPETTASAPVTPAPASPVSAPATPVPVAEAMPDSSAPASPIPEPVAPAATSPTPDDASANVPAANAEPAGA